MAGWALRAATSLLTATLLAGCAATDLRLYDQARATASAAIKTNYAEADVVGIVADQRQNLDALLAAELKIVRDNQQLQLDISLLELADNDTPMADTWDDEVVSPMEKLGFDTADAARDFLNATDRIPVLEQQMAGLSRRINKRTRTPPPACDDGVTFDDVFRNISITHGIYADACEDWQAATQMVDKNGGDIAAAQQRLVHALSAKQERAESVLAAKLQVKQAKSDHKAAVDAVQAANATAEEIRKQISEESAGLQEALEAAAQLAPSVLFEERIGAIVTLLKATAGETTEVEQDEDLARATLLLGGVSSLAADISGLVAEGRAPSVSNLLIELQHQTLLLQHARALDALAERRVEIRRAQLEGYIGELDQLQQLRDALCSFAYHMAEEERPGTACDAFVVSDHGRSCATKAGDTVSTDCALAKPWKVHLNDPPAGDTHKDKATRELYKALAAYTRVFPMRNQRLEQNFRLVDMQHRENLANRELALQALNNLAAVPIDEIDAYYSAGIKPEQVADLIVKALGFTAITVGVATR